ncbi:hypothetical protein HYV73_04020 [Candidatus Uhrbacteria bacterium]|nr:hypothetical protein [Candidatus Uhrbacteria bacterium]
MLLKSVGNIFAHDPTPLFPESPALSIVDSIEKVQTARKTPLLFPTETFGSTPYQIASYGAAADSIPDGLLIAAYNKDGRRTFEFSVYPNETMDQARSRIGETNAEPVKIGDVDGLLFHVNRSLPLCEPASEPRPIRLCQLGDMVAFAHEGAVYQVASDGIAMTDGELVAVGRSIVPETKTNPIGEKRELVPAPVIVVPPAPATTP